jgi:hypothetical protein
MSKGLVSSREAAFFAEKSGCTPEEETAMANQPDLNAEKSEMRVMWIGTLAIVLLLLGAMGINMLVTHTPPAGSVQSSVQPGTVSPK